MKKQILVAGAILISAISFGQKKEVRKAEKAIQEKDVAEAMTYLNEAEASIASADDDLKAQFYVVKGETYLADAGTRDFEKLKTAGEAFKKAKELNADKEYTQRADLGMQNLRVALVNSAVSDQNAKNYATASEKLYASYTLTKKDTSDLYFAAGNAVNAQQYDKALEYYQQLLDIGYTGIEQEFIATDIETGEIVTFATEQDRSTNMLSGKYTNPDERMAPSVRGDILRNVTLIYTSKGEDEKALAVMKDARAENPDDSSLIRAEADLAYKMGDMEKYRQLMEEVVASDPNNPELYYNLGVSSASIGEEEKALEYYKKALELNPEYALAQINIAALKLKQEAAIVEEMNNLGTSAADNKRYDELKEKRKQLYSEVLPYLESAVKLRPDNVELVRTLMNIYSQLGQDAKFKEMKARLAEMTQE
jgi:tetratricopeptide (TPR) repeat protein